MLYLFFYIIWTLIHMLYTVIEFLECIWTFIRKKYELLMWHKSMDERSLVSRHVKTLQKIPFHLVIILGNESVSFKDLANITVWCIAAGISFISFYDHRGVIKKRENELFKMLSVVAKDYRDNLICRKRHEVNGLKNQNGINGVASSQKTRINVFSLVDGKQSVVNIAKYLCKLVDTGEVTSSNITTELLQEKMREEIQVPDPDLAVYCGSTCSTYGFLPWQLRVTEFVNLPSHHNITVNEFVSLLSTYGNSEQRFGK